MDAPRQSHGTSIRQCVFLETKQLCRQIARIVHHGIVLLIINHIHLAYQQLSPDCQVIVSLSSWNLDKTGIGILGHLHTTKILEVAVLIDVVGLYPLYLLVARERNLQHVQLITVCTRHHVVELKGGFQSVSLHHGDGLVADQLPCSRLLSIHSGDNLILILNVFMLGVIHLTPVMRGETKGTSAIATPPFVTTTVTTESSCTSFYGICSIFIDTVESPRAFTSPSDKGTGVGVLVTCA